MRFQNGDDNLRWNDVDTEKNTYYSCVRAYKWLYAERCGGRFKVLI